MRHADATEGAQPPTTAIDMIAAARRRAETYTKVLDRGYAGWQASENFGCANFGECDTGEVRRILLLRLSEKSLEGSSRVCVGGTEGGEMALVAPF
jgi:hypothetical protein